MGNPHQRQEHDMAALFTPKGDVAEWRMVADALDALDIGDTLTYDELSDLLGRDFLTSRTPIYAATKWLERERRRTVDNVANVGYRIVEAAEHLDLGKRHHKKARRQMRRTIDRLASADRNLLDAEQVARIDSIEGTVRQQADVIRRIDKRVSKVEAAQATTVQQVDEHAERLARLEEALQRHGIESGR